MKLQVTGAVAAGAVLACLAGCSPPHPHGHEGGALKSVSGLDCPAEQGDLKLASGASGAGPCVYGDDAGDKITLTLVALNGQTPKLALAPFQVAAQAELPAMAPSAGGATASSTGANDGAGDGEKVDLDLPGIHIHANGSGKAQVNAMGVHVNADDKDHATVTGGFGGDHVQVNANEGGARIDVQESGSGVRSIFLLASDKPGPNGWRSAGYQARGPESGPLVVASILSKQDHDEDLRHDVKRLLERNVGG